MSLLCCLTQGEVSGLLKDLGYNKDQVYKF